MKIVAALCFLMSAPIYAGTAVIINANNNSGIDTVKKIYLGKVKAFPDGSRAIPLTFEQGNNIRDAFNNNVLGKSESQYSAFWSKLVFTGRGTPPEMIATEDEMLNLVATNPNTIGFVDEGKVDGTVKVVGTF
ncbi:MAG: phosphate ABC transporter substrate-binding protein [Pseudomonadota bacterium]|nr:phosphate ABC transporter substrate-binding protein [Pseudomonadota bacterium]